ncbi:MAG: peptidoglycan endopeptidase [Treponema sp.]|nr:peptidoglycan endopeptidase [Treponema sp.]
MKRLLLNNSIRLQVVQRKAVLCGLLFLFCIYKQASAQTDQLVSFSDPAHLWEIQIERVIEEAYRQFFATRIIGNRIMNIRLPFAMNNERDTLVERGWDIYLGGKGNPQTLWPAIDEILESQDFAEYLSALSSGREKVIIFYMEERRWSVSSDRFLIARIKSGAYRGVPHRPHVLTSGRGALESDVYNYLYCIGRIGVDCSGFVWHILSHVARNGGVDLSRVLDPSLRAPRGADPARFIGTAFFNSSSQQIISVNDEIRNLRPADVILFRDIGGTVVHSAIIQSIDLTRGVIRYLQCTNVSPQDERGAHDSFIYFDPQNPNISLKDPNLVWSQRRSPPFTGEEVPFTNDGEIYRHRVNGGGRVVRLRALVPVVERLNRN